VVLEGLKAVMERRHRRSLRDQVSSSPAKTALHRTLADADHGWFVGFAPAESPKSSSRIVEFGLHDHAQAHIASQSSPLPEVGPIKATMDEG